MYRKYKDIDKYLRENCRYECYYENKYDTRNVFDVNKGLNCSDSVNYDNFSEDEKRSFVFACMSIVFENWDNRTELIKFQNDLYDFDLVKEFNSFFGLVKG